jgi:hypothetical protein
MSAPLAGSRKGGHVIVASPPAKSGYRKRPLDPTFISVW